MHGFVDTAIYILHRQCTLPLQAHTTYQQHLNMDTGLKLPRGRGWLPMRKPGPTGQTRNFWRHSLMDHTQTLMTLDDNVWL